MNRQQQRNEIASIVRDTMRSNMHRSIDGGYVELDDNDIDNISIEIADTLVLDYCPISEYKENIKWRDVEIMALQEDYRKLEKQCNALEDYINERHLGCGGDEAKE